MICFTVIAPHADVVGLGHFFVAATCRTDEVDNDRTGVLLAPLHNPVRLAEDAATVQLLAEGG